MKNLPICSKRAANAGSIDQRGLAGHLRQRREQAQRDAHRCRPGVVAALIERARPAAIAERDQLEPHELLLLRIPLRLAAEPRREAAVAVLHARFAEILDAPDLVGLDPPHRQCRAADVGILPRRLLAAHVVDQDLAAQATHDVVGDRLGLGGSGDERARIVEADPVLVPRPLDEAAPTEAVTEFAPPAARRLRRGPFARAAGRAATHAGSTPCRRPPAAPRFGHGRHRAIAILLLLAQRLPALQRDAAAALRCRRGSPLAAALPSRYSPSGPIM